MPGIAVTRRQQVLRFLDKAEQDLSIRVGHVPSIRQLRQDAPELAYASLPAEWQTCLDSFHVGTHRYSYSVDTGKADVETSIQLGYITREEVMEPKRDIPNVSGAFAEFRSQLQIAPDEDAIKDIVMGVRHVESEVTRFKTEEDN
jgi:hypothetical protein